jgi:hypothetical protein
VTVDDHADPTEALRGPRTCRECLHHMDPWRSVTGRQAWHCLHCDRFEI